MQILTLPGFDKIFGAPKPPELPVPPPLPERTDPAVAEAKEKLRLSERRRRGRRAAVLTGGRGVEEELGSVSRPEARAAKLGSA